MEQEVTILKDFTNIATGFYHRSKFEGDTLYLQVKHFNQQGKFRKDATFKSELLLEDNMRKHLLQDKDLLMLAKGANNRVLLYDKRIGQAVASSSFLIIRMTSALVLPEYLLWFFNTASTQKQLSYLAIGSHIRSLSKKALEKMPIVIPPIDIQKQILMISDTWKKERKLTQQLLKDKESYYEHLLFKLSTKESI